MPKNSFEFKPPLRIAHRGASAEAPENTVPAIRLAFEKYKVDMVEFDVRISKDGVPVLIHDETLERTTNGSGRVRDHSLSELKQLQVTTPSPKNRGQAAEPTEVEQPVPSFPSVRYGAGARIEIPTLEEVLREFQGKGNCPLFFIEIKDKDALAGEKVFEVIRKVPHAPLVIVGSFHSAPILKLRGQASKRCLSPSLETALTRREVIFAYLLFRLGLKKFNSQARFASLPKEQKRGLSPRRGTVPFFRFDDPAWIEFLHRSGVRVFYWTVNDVEEAKELIRSGADGILSDYPDRLNQALT